MEWPHVNLVVLFPKFLAGQNKCQFYSHTRLESIYMDMESHQRIWGAPWCVCTRVPWVVASICIVLTHNDSGR